MRLMGVINNINDKTSKNLLTKSPDCYRIVLDREHDKQAKNGGESRQTDRTKKLNNMPPNAQSGKLRQDKSEPRRLQALAEIMAGVGGEREPMYIPLKRGKLKQRQVNEMKFKTTQKAIKSGYSKIIRVGYCNLHYTLADEKPIAYTTRAEGWAADIYAFGDTAIVTGYAPFGTIRAGYDKCQEYEKTAKQITGERRKERRRELIDKFIKEMGGK